MQFSAKLKIFSLAFTNRMSFRTKLFFCFADEPDDHKLRHTEGPNAKDMAISGPQNDQTEHKK